MSRSGGSGSVGGRLGTAGAVGQSALTTFEMPGVTPDLRIVRSSKSNSCQGGAGQAHLDIEIVPRKSERMDGVPDHALVCRDARQGLMIETSPCGATSRETVPRAGQHFGRPLDLSRRSGCKETARSRPRLRGLRGRALSLDGTVVGGWSAAARGSYRLEKRVCTPATIRPSRHYHHRKCRFCGQPFSFGTHRIENRRGPVSMGVGGGPIASVWRASGPEPASG